MFVAGNFVSLYLIYFPNTGYFVQSIWIMKLLHALELEVKRLLILKYTVDLVLITKSQRMKKEYLTILFLHDSLPVL